MQFHINSFCAFCFSVWILQPSLLSSDQNLFTPEIQKYLDSFSLANLIPWYTRHVSSIMQHLLAFFLICNTTYSRAYKDCCQVKTRTIKPFSSLTSLPYSLYFLPSSRAVLYVYTSLRITSGDRMQKEHIYTFCSSLSLSIAKLFVYAICVHNIYNALYARACA